MDILTIYCRRLFVTLFTIRARQVRWKNHRRICATILRYNGLYSAGDGDYGEYNGVLMVGDDNDWDTYRAGESIDVTATFDSAVAVEGSPVPSLLLDGDMDPDDIGIGATSIGLTGGGIHDDTGNAAGLSHEAMAADGGRKLICPLMARRC